MISHLDEGRELGLNLSWGRRRRLAFNSRNTLDGSELSGGLVEVGHEVADEWSHIVHVSLATGGSSICPTFTTFVEGVKARLTDSAESRGDRCPERAEDGMGAGRILNALESGRSGEREHAEREQDEEGGNAGELHVADDLLDFRGLAGC